MVRGTPEHPNVAYGVWLTLQLPVFVVEAHACLLHLNLLPGGAVNTSLTRTILDLQGQMDQGDRVRGQGEGTN